MGLLRAIKTTLFQRWRINRRPSNCLMMIWLQQALRRDRHLTEAVDIGCGKAINRHLFGNPRYTGVDVNEENLVAARARYPDDCFVRGDLGLEAVPAGDLVVCTLVLHNKQYPPERTVAGARRLIDATRAGGTLIFTTSQANAPYEEEIDALVGTAFESVTKRLYGRFNVPTYAAVPMAWMMYLLPSLRRDPNNRMILYRCRARRTTDPSGPGMLASEPRGARER